MEYLFWGVIALIVIGAIFKPRRCDICDTYFKKSYYTWTIDGKKQHLCPNCNNKMSRRVSSAKFNNRFG